MSKFYEMKVYFQVDDDIDPTDEFWANHLDEALTECPSIEGWIFDRDNPVQIDKPIDYKD